jgi:hypothetical protein
MAAPRKTPLLFRRKVYVFHVEAYNATRDLWQQCGGVILPDNAYRFELSNALRVFGIHAPHASDRVSWSYSTLPGNLVTGPLPWPKARISDVHGRPLVRLSARETSTKTSEVAR